MTKIDIITNDLWNEFDELEKLEREKGIHFTENFKKIKELLLMLTQAGREEREGGVRKGKQDGNIKSN